MLGLPLDSWLLILVSAGAGPALVVWFFSNQRRNLHARGAEPRRDA